MTIEDVVTNLEHHESGRVPYSKPEGELVVGTLAVGRKPFGYPWPENKWWVYFRTKRESYDVLLFDSESEACANFLRKVLRDQDLKSRFGRMSKSDLMVELDGSGIDSDFYSLDGNDSGDVYVLDRLPRRKLDGLILASVEAVGKLQSLRLNRPPVSICWIDA
jgi:hypothetical protein